LPYEAVRTAADPAAEVRVFFEDAYQAGATLGRWDREALERELQPRDEHGAATHGDLHPTDHDSAP
jgi:Family of unknown function (DUF5996)